MFQLDERAIKRDDINEVIGTVIDIRRNVTHNGVTYPLVYLVSFPSGCRGVFLESELLKPKKDEDK
jgi:hypothetical protein